MYVVDKQKGEISTLPAKEIKRKQIKAITSELAQKIVMEIAKKAMYPKQIAKSLKVNEQKVYYHIRNLEKSRIIEVTKTGTVQGAVANYYSLVEPAFVIKFKEFQKSQKLIDSKQESVFEPFVENGQLKATIIVGSPDPHGPEKARSRDGYYAVDFALFLGTFMDSISELNVKLDTEAREEDLKDNLILIGGPVVNTIVERINSKLPISFDKEDNWNVVSSISGNIYHTDETGVIAKIKNPFNNKKQILLLAGKRYAGTKAVMIALIKHFKEIFKGNKHDKKVFAKVVEGIDFDSDGMVDAIEILE